MNQKNYVLISIFVVVILIGAGFYFFSVQKSATTNPTPPVSVVATTTTYTNNTYGFSFTLPLSWVGYSIVTTTWQGESLDANGQNQASESGPEISIRNPNWTTATPTQDIPIMVFTIAEWNALQNNQFHIGAAPINPSELGQNNTYVFGLPARYNYAFPADYQEVDQIIQGNNFHGF